MTLIRIETHPAADAFARVRGGAVAWLLLLVVVPASAQDLEPRAYANAPVNATFLVTGLSLSLSKGAVVRYGTDFSTFSFGWQTAWVPRPTPTP